MSERKINGTQEKLFTHDDLLEIPFKKHRKEIRVLQHALNDWIKDVKSRYEYLDRKLSKMSNNSHSYIDNKTDRRWDDLKNINKDIVVRNI